jgi:TonB-dependent receptor
MKDSLFIERRARVRCCGLGLCLAFAGPSVALAQTATQTGSPRPPAALTVSEREPIGDGVDGAELARTLDLSAAEATQRIVGATIIGDQSVSVRGMGARYSSALLNGVPLPVMATDGSSVPLDLFPALVLDRLTITRQSLPDVPADFAAGLLRIDTQRVPPNPIFQVSLRGAFNTESTWKKRLGYDGSNTDWLGFDSGRRSFPSGIPNQKLDSARTTTAQQVEYGHRFDTPLVTFMKATPPNFGVRLVAGNSYAIAPNATLGVLAALTYDRTYQSEGLTQRIFSAGALPDGTRAVLVNQEYSGQRAIDSVRLAAFASTALELSPRHTLSLLGFHVQSADDSTSDLQSPGASGVHATHLEYLSRALNVLQLRGEHHFPGLADLEIDWQTSVASASRDQPDTRDVSYQLGQRDGVPGWNVLPDASGQHQYLNQSDTTLTAGFDLLQPLVKAEAHETELKLGALVSSSDSDFRARRFQLVPAREPGFLYNQLSFCPGATWSGGCPNYLYRPDLIRSDGLLLSEWTLDHDQYQSRLEVYAAYGMVEAKLLPKLRAIVGERVEITFQEFAAFDPFDRADTEERSQIFDTDWLPAGSLIYEATAKSDLRLATSQTLIRPEPRELSPAPSTNSAGELPVQGNPALTVSKVTNLDLRFEYYPTLPEMLAAGVFYKHLRNPIERIDTGLGSLNFTNADHADVLGAEFEGRKSLEDLGAPLRDFWLVASVTLTQSTVKLGARNAFATRDNRRPLAEQAPYVVNLVLEYANRARDVEVRLLYDVSGPRETTIGENGLPDTYEMPRHSLGVSAAKRFAKHLELKLQAQNILNTPVVFAYRDQQAYRQTDAMEYQSLGRQPETERFNPGLTLAATATYSY